MSVLGLAWILGGTDAAVHASLAPRFDAAAVGPTLSGEAPQAVPLAVRMQRGQALGPLLDEIGLDPSDRQAVIGVVAEHLDVRKLRPGLELTAWVEGDGPPGAVVVTVPGVERVRVTKSDRGWVGHAEEFRRHTEQRVSHGVVVGSLVGALADAGAPEMVAYRMAEVLRWDIDFNRDLRAGDRFQVVWEEEYLEGRPHGVGQVVAVNFWNRGRKLEAYRFDQAYYDEEGRPLRKMFLRSPLPFSRVTSKFSHRRFHPVLKTYRPHYGVDYGAPTGTPVRVTADGVVRFAGWTKGGGRMVKVSHPNEFLTAYLHLSGFGSGVKVGRRVRQGDVIGYVGSTGLSTGPHLDYRVQHRGSWIDPLSIKSVPAEPIADERMLEFVAHRDEARGRLVDDSASPTGLRVASELPPLEASSDTGP